MARLRILVTCPPMIRSIERYADRFAGADMEITCPTITQVLTESELVEMVGRYDGWIIGDDPATAKVFRAGVAGRLKAAVKWGVGVDNVDRAAAQALGIDVSHTPGMFGDEVADIAMGYVIGLARHTYWIDDGVRGGQWPKPVGISLRNRTAAVVGFGDIGKAIASRLIASHVKVNVYDPHADDCPHLAGQVTRLRWLDRLHEASFLILCCCLNEATRHIINRESLESCSPGVRIVNVSRGQLIDEEALANCLQSGHVHSAALEVFEMEPLPKHSRLRESSRCIFGSHNASNTQEAVDRASNKAIDLLTSSLRAVEGCAL